MIRRSDPSCQEQEEEDGRADPAGLAVPADPADSGDRADPADRAFIERLRRHRRRPATIGGRHTAGRWAVWSI